MRSKAWAPGIYCTASKTSNGHNCIVATASTQPSAHELGELLVVANLEAQPQLVGRRRRTQDRFSLMKRVVGREAAWVWLGCREVCGLRACLRSAFAPFFGVAKVPRASDARPQGIPMGEP